MYRAYAKSRLSLAVCVVAGFVLLLGAFGMTYDMPYALAVPDKSHTDTYGNVHHDAYNHLPPLQQHDVEPSEIRCNDPRHLYVLNSQPVCLFDDTYESLLSLGMDIIKTSPYTKTDISIDLTDEEAQWLHDNPVIRVSYDPHWFPVEYVDESGNLAGVTVKYMEKFEKIIGADFEAAADIPNWTHALESIKTRSSDIIMLAAYTEDRSEYMSFTTPHYIVETSLATLTDVQLDITDPDIRLLTPRNYAIEGWLDANHPDIPYISVDDIKQGLEILQSGDADAFAITWQVIRAVAEQEGITVYNAGPTGYSYDLSIGYRNDQPLLGSILQKTLDSIPVSKLEILQSTTDTYIATDASIDLTDEEAQWIHDNQIIRVSYDPNWFPFEYIDEYGKLAGVTPAYIKHFEAVTGADFEPVKDIPNWTHALESIETRSSDVIMLVTPTSDRAEYMSFTTSHYVADTVLITLEDTHLDITEPGLRILTIRDYSIESWLDDNLPYVHYTSVNDVQHGLDILQTGEYDAFAASWAVVYVASEKEGITIHDAGPTGHAHDLTVGYRSDQPILGSILQKALDSMPTHTIEKLFKMSPQ